MLYSDEVTITGGTSVDTFGTAGSITLGNQARRILGIITSACDTVYTAAQGASEQLQVVSSSLSIADTRFKVGPFATSGPATNSSGQGNIPEVIPLDIPCAGGEVLNFKTAPSTAVTTGRSRMVQLLYTDANPAPPADWLARFPNCVPARDGFTVDAAQLTTTRTALSNITVPSWAKEIIGIKVTDIKTGAITAAQYEQIYVEITGTIPNITPNKWISNSLGATLGTPVGTGAYDSLMPYLPMWIPLSGRTETITPYVNLVGAVSTGNEVSVGLLWR